MIMDKQSLEYARSLDGQDALSPFRKQFRIPMRDGKEQIYFLGNSLGLQPLNTEWKIREVLEAWADHGVEAFFTGSQPWMSLHDQLANPMADIVGALPSEISVMNQLTINLHLLMASFYRPTQKKYKILCEAKAFPSDQYMLESLCRYLGRNPDDALIEVKPQEGEFLLKTPDILQAIEKHKDELALVFLGGVNYYTGQVLDMQAITHAAKAADIMVGFDLAHAAGNIPLQLHDWNVDFAAWCNYKYLNAGPGAVASAFIHERYHSDKSLNRLAGWWGYDKASRFKMEKGFIPETGAVGWQVSTPPILLYAALQASLDIFVEAGIEALIKKGRSLSAYLLELLKSIQEKQKQAPFQILTPSESSAHGCQVSMLFPVNGKKIFDALTANGVFADWREPDVIRVAPVPLYNTFEEVWQFAHILEQSAQG